MSEEIGKHKGAVETLMHEKKELTRLLQIVDSQLQRHMKALKENGVDPEEYIESLQEAQEERRQEDRRSGEGQAPRDRKGQKNRQPDTGSNHGSTGNQARETGKRGGGSGKRGGIDRSADRGAPDSERKDRGQAGDRTENGEEEEEKDLDDMLEDESDDTGQSRDFNPL
ncbi:MAG: hypothetical protein ABEK01_00385 [Candidatus Nanohaloarchaea archaeon]